MTSSKNSRRYGWSPRTSSMRARTASRSIPGGVRQSTSSSARAGITLILSLANARVGDSVTPSIGSTKVASHGSCARTCSSAAAGSPSTSTPSAASSAVGAVVTSKSGWRSRIACSSGATFSSAFSPL